MATNSSILDWKIPQTEEPGGLQSMGLQKVRLDRVIEHVCLLTFGSAWLIHVHQVKLLIILFKPSTSFMIFCLVVQLVTERFMSESTLDMPTSSSNSINFCFIK